MTAEFTPNSNRDDDAALFAQIVEASWGTDKPLERVADDGIRRLLEDAKKIEIELNNAVAVSPHAIADAIQALEKRWKMLQLSNDPVSISGRLYPSEFAYDSDFTELHEKGAFPALTTQYDDSNEPYLRASGFEARVQFFDVLDPAVDDTDTYRVVLMVSPYENYEDDEDTAWFILHPDDIDLIETYYPSAEG